MAGKFEARPPDYNVSALNKNTEVKGNVGVAWKQSDGTIRVKINAFVVLEGGEPLVLTLFPNNGSKPSAFDTMKSEARKKPGGIKPSPGPRSSHPLIPTDDNIPF